MQEQRTEDLKERVLTLKELVGYQEGAVVSRMVVFKAAGTITVFSFDAGEGLSEHTAPYDAVLTVLEGTVEVAIAGKAFRLKEGETIILPAHKPHALTALQRFKMMLTMIHD